MIDEKRLYRALQAVEAERRRQESLRDAGKFDATCADLAPRSGQSLAILTEELGEVARALNEKEPIEHLREELIQVAAVAVAWAEACDDE
jgi:NTP pyrophosphatase (non-canonical NTP hydrolase)